MNNISINGLDSKEFDTYKSLLRSKRATVLELSQTTGVKRINLYRILDALKSKGLVSEVYEGKKHFFIAESPKALLKLVNREREKVTSILLELEVLEKEALERPKIKFFEGKESVKALYDELLTERSEVLAFACPDKLLDAIEFHDPYWLKRRLKLKIPARAIYPYNKAGIKRSKIPYKETRLSRTMRPFESTFIISGNKVVTFSHKRWITGVLIDNKEIADGLRAFFDAYWEDLGKKKR